MAIRESLTSIFIQLKGSLVSYIDAELASTLKQLEYIQQICLQIRNLASVAVHARDNQLPINDPQQRLAAVIEKLWRQNPKLEEDLSDVLLFDKTRLPAEHHRLKQAISSFSWGLLK